MRPGPPSLRLTLFLAAEGKAPSLAEAKRPAGSALRRSAAAAAGDQMESPRESADRVAVCRRSWSLNCQNSRS
uniref:Uncharacterized protein n=1 Tax=Arundo donax TaxID=35708 RepID=A0A0A9FP15_ARUDO